MSQSALPTLGHFEGHHYDPWGRTPDQVRLEVFFEHKARHAGTDDLREMREQAEVEAFCVSGLGHQVEQEDLGGRGISFYCRDCDTDMSVLFDLNPKNP